MGKRVAVLGDLSSHGGTLISTNQDDRHTLKNIPVCVEGCLHDCPQEYSPGVPHGVTPVTAVTLKSYVNGKLIVTEGAVAGCGAVITPPDRKYYTE